MKAEERAEILEPNRIAAAEALDLRGKRAPLLTMPVVRRCFSTARETFGIIRNIWRPGRQKTELHSSIRADNPIDVFSL